MPGGESPGGKAVEINREHALPDLSFSPEEQAEREQFLEWIQTDGPPPCKWEY